MVGNPHMGNPQMGMPHMDPRMAWQHHLMMASTHMILAKKYMYSNLRLHFHHDMQHLYHTNEMERAFYAMMHQPTGYMRSESVESATASQ